MEQYNIFVYGSLMHPDEITKLFGDDNINYTTAILQDHVRDFSKISHSWGPENENVGVLGLQKCNQEYCNGLVLKNITKQQLNNYYKRETGFTIQNYQNETTGYTIQKIDPDKFNIYLTNPVSTAIINKRLKQPNTHQEYKKLCYNAAKQYGTEFYQTFKKTTYNYYKF